MLERAQIIKFQQRGDEKGWLVAVESGNEIPFDIKRIFYIFGTQGNVVRGKHANRKSEFVLINLAGSSKVRVDYGDSEEVFVLDSPDTGLYIPKLVWKDMYDFSPDSVLLVLSNEQYDTQEYIRDKQQYCKEIGVTE
ncbi:MAG: FdtA/QdtA family cupin domain-containing protein [Clostridia bacterium]|nr:FdtA/QdtA family cupin domain-containing protein [Clostridia bacterium]